MNIASNGMLREKIESLSLQLSCQRNGKKETNWDKEASPKFIDVETIKVEIYHMLPKSTKLPTAK